MSSTNPFKDQSSSSLTKKLLRCILYALLPLALIRLYFYPLTPSLSPTNQFPHTKPPIITTTATATTFTSPSPPSSKEHHSSNTETPCDYSNGKWVPDKFGPLYNGTSCGTIKDGQNCMSHGRPDQDYLYWSWEPKDCKISRFDPKIFLHFLRNKHLAFVGDSMARNQLESLLCMLSTASKPELVYNLGDDNKFRRWHFKSHNVNVSIYWSPFLVKGIEKTEIANYNRLFLDSVDERWASDLDKMDMVVLSVGHWFLHPAVYFYGESVLGCHYCVGQNYTEVGFYDVFGKAFKTTLETIMERRGGGGGGGGGGGSDSDSDSGKGIDVVVTTFSPHHFEGEWDKLGACPKTQPFKEGEKQLEGMDAEMRKAEVGEVEAAKEKAKKFSRIRLSALDVTKLSLMRPDGHPGPYMYANPFANGIAERVQNDCVHWCLPGAIDTWNEILLDVMKRWDNQSRWSGGR
ncbi:Protein ALTERED XYLOGLUCAN 4 [Camellia lanceoleosa]|uniref:Protein ALTERED XYLOGLUCAN 4 n=1 Tax=Camellia lanceoleosa TaxID=1840588 RepID=A0ACC0IAM6_9ERIC|nr:Protein ALTERED XYLOGLUCAN 4 [Camellia lanceoleosa]